MITKLTKFTFLVFHREYNELLDKLREAGVVHIIGKVTGEGEEHPAGELINELRRYDNAIRLLKRSIPDNESLLNPDQGQMEPSEVVNLVESLTLENEDLKNRIQSLRIEASKVEAWGDYKYEDIGRLLTTGWQLSFFSCQAKKFSDEWYNRYSIQVINTERGKTYFAVVHRPGEEIVIDADPEKIGEKSAPKLLEEVSGCQKRIEENNDRLIRNSASWLETAGKGRISILNSVEYRVAEKQARPEAGGNLMILQGWVPADAQDSVKQLVETTGAYYYESEPEEGEKVPVMLRNGKFAKLFEPIAKLFALPDYRELDLTPFFAPFFMLFFGFCLGDAGYGLVFVAAAFLFYKKVPKAMRPFLSLAKYLGTATVIFGIISGTFFGMNLIDSGYTLTSSGIQQLRDMRVPAQTIEKMAVLDGKHFKTRKEFLDAASDAAGADEVKKHKTRILKASDPDVKLLKSFRHIMQDSLSMFYLAIGLGAIQIIFGMIVKIMNITVQRGFIHSLSTLGWVILLLTVVVFKGGAAAGFIDAEATKVPFYIFMGIAGVLIFLLNNLSINVFFRIGSGVWDTYNVATGIFGDLLSYIRLFALGISSGILGFVFNDISSQFLSIPYIGWIFFVLLLLIGHSINIFMAALGGFIHPMRLTFVEFYKNAGFKGGGKEYRPFRINS